MRFLDVDFGWQNKPTGLASGRRCEGTRLDWGSGTGRQSLSGCSVRKWGYPPDRQEQATHTVLEQAALFSEQEAAP